jgi:hypothetical protein
VTRPPTQIQTAARIAGRRSAITVQSCHGRARRSQSR